MLWKPFQSSERLTRCQFARSFRDPCYPAASSAACSGCCASYSSAGISISVTNFYNQCITKCAFVRWSKYQIIHLNRKQTNDICTLVDPKSQNQKKKGELWCNTKEFLRNTHIIPFVHIISGRSLLPLLPSPAEGLLLLMLRRLIIRMVVPLMMTPSTAATASPTLITPNAGLVRRLTSHTLTAASAIPVVGTPRTHYDTPDLKLSASGGNGTLAEACSASSRGQRERGQAGGRRHAVAHHST